MDKKEARILSYTLFYNTSGRLITERTSTDISSLKKFLSLEEFNTLTILLREATIKLDKIHNEIEKHLNARLLGG